MALSANPAKGMDSALGGNVPRQRAVGGTSECLACLLPWARHRALPYHQFPFQGGLRSEAPKKCGKIAENVWKIAVIFFRKLGKPGALVLGTGQNFRSSNVVDQ